MTSGAPKYEGAPGTPGVPAGPVDLTRRQFIVGATALAGAAALTLAGCGSTGMPSGPSASANRWIRLPTAGLVAGQPRWVSFNTSPGASLPTALAGPDATAAPVSGASLGAWLVLQADGSIVAFQPACTHERCRYDWDKVTTRFHCRCHNGFFSADGTVLEGPPPRPLDRFQVRVAVPDMIEIGWVDPA